LTPRPYNPRIELTGALDRGNLRQAITLAEELRIEGKPIDLDTAARFLPLIAHESPREYDAWALRWLTRWLSESGARTIEQTADLLGLLADLPGDPDALEGLPRLL
jgi:hypothetical protein